MSKDFPKKIMTKTQVKFAIGLSGLYAIKIIARCSKRDDLRVEIDDQFFREIPQEKNIQKYDIPPAWNGTKLKGKSQINIFLLHLEFGEHTLTFIPRGHAQVESYDFWKIVDPTNIELNLKQQAENGNVRPWITISLIHLPLKSIIADVSVDWHLFDGDDPKWNENFQGDTTTIILARMIFGEARNQSQEAMTGVGWVIKNRVNANKKYFGSNYHEVILKNDGKYWQFSSFIPSDPNFKILIDPLSNNAEETDKKAWFNSYDIASKIVGDLITDPTEGATFFHSTDLSQEKFTTQSVPGAIFIKRIGDFLFYKDPNES